MVNETVRIAIKQIYTRTVTDNTQKAIHPGSVKRRAGFEAIAVGGKAVKPQLGYYVPSDSDSIYRLRLTTRFMIVPVSMISVSASSIGSLSAHFRTR